MYYDNQILFTSFRSDYKFIRRFRNKWSLLIIILVGALVCIVAVWEDLALRSVSMRGTRNPTRPVSMSLTLPPISPASPPLTHPPSEKPDSPTPGRSACSTAPSESANATWLTYRNEMVGLT